MWLVRALKVENGAKRSGSGSFLREYGLVSLWQLCPSGLDGKLLQSALAPAIRPPGVMDEHIQVPTGLEPLELLWRPLALHMPQVYRLVPILV